MGVGSLKVIPFLGGKYFAGEGFMADVFLLWEFLLRFELITGVGASW
jgi:hypothetical protein